MKLGAGKKRNGERNGRGENEKGDASKNSRERKSEARRKKAKKAPLRGIYNRVEPRKASDSDNPSMALSSGNRKENNLSKSEC